MTKHLLRQLGTHPTKSNWDAMQTHDAIVIGSCQAGPFLAVRLAQPWLTGGAVGVDMEEAMAHLVPLYGVGPGARP